VTVGDLDGDGDLDIATTNSGSSSVSVFLNNGSATFTAADGNPFAVGVSPGGIVMGDFDEDGRLDLSTANFGSNSTSILINTDVDTPPTAVTFSNVHGPFAENASTAAAIKVADITVVDADNGPNILSLAGGDAAQFQIIGGDLWLKAGAHLDFETNPVLNITVNVNAPGVGGAIDASRSLAIPVNNVTEPINGTDAPNFLFGTPSGETISGLGGNDRIIANAGNDRIVGGLGADVVTGGAGSDVFAVLSIHQSAPAQSGLTNGVFDAAAGQGLRDIITDFAPGVDKLDLSTMDARTDIAGNQGFNWRGAGDFTGVAGQLIYRLFDRVDAVNDKTIIYGDVNGDSRADFQVQLTGLKILTVGDLIA
jgi:Ca2+-binding RTX toxin-like protein